MSPLKYPKDMLTCIVKWAETLTWSYFTEEKELFKHQASQFPPHCGPKYDQMRVILTNMTQFGACGPIITSAYFVVIPQ